MLKRISILGTPLVATTYAALREDLLRSREEREARTVDFSNTQIVTARRHDPRFRQVTEVVDTFVPDGMPLIWCMNARGAGLKDRVYGPTFTRLFLEASPPEARHFFLGGSDECLERLIARMKALNPLLHVTGSHHGYFQPADEKKVAAQIQGCAPDFLWVGLGTPKQQEWISRNRLAFPTVIILAVGFAFDVNAGLKTDAPAWMQRAGLTWLYRMLSEPRRLVSRYLKYNLLFLRYLLQETLGR